MFGLLVSHRAEDLSIREIAVDRRRYLEYTAEEISRQLDSLTTDAVAFLLSQPAIVMDEGKGNELARLVRLRAVEARPFEVNFKFEPLLVNPSLLNESLWKLRAELDIEQFEFSRHHFAVKNGDVLLALRQGGFEVPPDRESAFKGLALPAPSRSELLSVKTALQGMAHAELDDLLLEVGIGTLKAGRELGSVRDRASAIIKFAMENPGAATAEHRLLSTFLAERIVKSPAQPKTKLIEEPLSVQVDQGVNIANAGRSPNRVFIVHGQNESVRNDVVSFLDEIGLKGIVLHEQPNMGRHLLTKFIEEADLVTFAIIIMTDDDVGGLKGKSQRPRARQNVILELGYFISHLGQERVCALVTPNLETPSDFDGIVYIRMDSRGDWREQLVRELVAAEMPVIKMKSDTRGKSLPRISKEGEALLKAAAADTHGTILKLSMMSGMEIQAGETTFGAGGAREGAKWEQALKELLQKELVVARGSKGQVFELTHLGWTVADSV